MALEKNQNSTMEYNNITNSDSAALLPHLESFEKMLKLPVVEAAWHQSQDVYGRVKGKFFIPNLLKIKFIFDKQTFLFFIRIWLRFENMLVFYIKMWPNYTQLQMRKKEDGNSHKHSGQFYSVIFYNEIRALFVKLLINSHLARFDHTNITWLNTVHFQFTHFMSSIYFNDSIMFPHCTFL